MYISCLSNTQCYMFSLACPDFYFGQDCKEQCHCENDTKCDKVNGTCPLGLCAAGYEGSDCQTYKGITSAGMTIHNA